MQLYSSGFSRKIKGAKGLDLPSTVFWEKHVYSTNTREYLSTTRVFHEKKCIKKITIQASYFLIKNRAVDDSMALGGFLPPP